MEHGTEEPGRRIIAERLTRKQGFLQRGAERCTVSSSMGFSSSSPSVRGVAGPLKHAKMCRRVDPAMSSNYKRNENESRVETSRLQTRKVDREGSSFDQRQSTSGDAD
ncbi:hypothetical protein FA13DRAFT_145560 [Coprinellus micaceus]|uniref:Uncharacterized protein n=1 Tax=Coprinellus micaceus TaxID=71717 RepID=A0A4Y7SH64_COPMI|nr:hypothetical protein FA13DRAFT_145560 [Coprinellus micaceus]